MRKRAKTRIESAEMERGKINFDIFSCFCSVAPALSLVHVELIVAKSAEHNVYVYISRTHEIITLNLHLSCRVEARTATAKCVDNENFKFFESAFSGCFNDESLSSSLTEKD